MLPAIKKAGKIKFTCLFSHKISVNCYHTEKLFINFTYFGGNFFF